MKLYTEEQVKQMTQAAFTAGQNHNTFIFGEVYKNITPIELPSDEEIKKMMDLDGMEFDEFDPYDVSYLGGATWMRNKIQGGNK
jgi:hypothetical protein